MISYELFSGLAFAYRVQKKNGGPVITEGDGALFSQPKYGKADLQFLDSIREAGWSRSPEGYAAYACSLGARSSDLLILHGLKVVGVSTAQGKGGDLTIKLTREKLESYVRGFLAAVESANTRFGAALAESIHEIRSVNSALYNAGYELQNRLIGHGADGALSKNITSLSELISQRIELVDFLAGGRLTDAEADEEVHVFKKFDKLYKCFKALAKSRNIELQLTGVSRGTVKGTRHFELIPLLLIDNAVKYSPDGRGIQICVSETTTEITCIVSSVGPLVRDDEREKIFSQGYRGEYAKKSGSSGSGIGLYFLSELVESSLGRIIFDQGAVDVAKTGGIPYRLTEFQIIFPLSKTA